jgi:predicted phage gp36 major capsid-like protein
LNVYIGGVAIGIMAKSKTVQAPDVMVRDELASVPAFVTTLKSSTWDMSPPSSVVSATGDVKPAGVEPVTSSELQVIRTARRSPPEIVVAFDAAVVLDPVAPE